VNRWPIARYLLSTHYVFLLFVLFGFYVACGVLLTVVALLADIRISTVDVGGQVLCWLALGYGASATTTWSTMMVHGRTRREFLTQYPVFLAALTVTAAALIAAVYAGEAALYRAFGWGQTLQDQRVFTSASDFPTVFVTYLSMLLVWLLVGAFLGSAFYRWEGSAVLALIPAAGLVLVAGGFNGFFAIVPALRAETSNLLVILAVTAGLVAVCWALLWGTVRDMSLRLKSTG
jgi:hypothetical protein